MTKKPSSDLTVWVASLSAQFVQRLGLSVSDMQDGFFYATLGPFDALKYMKQSFQPVPEEDAFAVAATGLDDDPFYNAVYGSVARNIDDALKDVFAAKFGSSGPFLYNIAGGINHDADIGRVMQMAYSKSGTLQEIRDVIHMLKTVEIENGMKLQWRILFTTSGMYNDESRISIDSYGDSHLGGQLNGLALTNQSTVMGRYHDAMTNGIRPEGGFTDFDYGPEFVVKTFGPSIFTDSSLKDFGIRAIPSDRFFEVISQNGDIAEPVRYIIGIQNYKLK
jgi:hypothetical protein